MGSLGLFLFGMKLMSESLQKVAGRGIRDKLARMTSNPGRGIFTGFVVTSAVQSSSASIVMVLSFVNAGLLSLFEAVSVIMGANIGTTVTAWLVTILGFEVNFSMFLLPLIALTLPLLFSRKHHFQNWGYMLVGFAIMFLALDFLKDSIPEVSAESPLIREIGSLSHSGFLSTILFVGIGIVLTIILQSSSATMALTFVMVSKGWISFELAAAMVLGENIGTTFTAIIAGLVANAPAKRAALSHLLFNIFGVIWAVLLLNIMLIGVDKFTLVLENRSPFAEAAVIPVALSIFHTAFNVINTLIFVGLIRWIIGITEKLLPVKEDEKHIYRLEFINSSVLSTSELSVLQARKEISLYCKRVTRMFELVPNLLVRKDLNEYGKMLERIEKYKNITDNMVIEIESYLSRLSESDLSSHSSERINLMLRITDHINSIAEAIYRMTKLIDKKNQGNYWFTQGIRNKLNRFFETISRMLNELNKNLSREYENVELDAVLKMESDIDQMRQKYQRKNEKHVRKEKYYYESGVFYSKIIDIGEQIADLILKTNRAVAESRRQK